MRRITINPFRGMPLQTFSVGLHISHFPLVQLKMNLHCDTLAPVHKLNEFSKLPNSRLVNKTISLDSSLIVELYWRLLLRCKQRFLFKLKFSSLEHRRFRTTMVFPSAIGTEMLVAEGRQTSIESYEMKIRIMYALAPF